MLHVTRSVIRHVAVAGAVSFLVASGVSAREAQGGAQVAATRQGRRLRSIPKT